MDIEFEAKFYPINKEKIRTKLKNLGAELVFPERKMRRAIVDQRVYGQLKCDYIRVRDEGNVIRMSAKTHAREGGKLDDQKEVEVEVSDYEKTLQIIELMGFKFDKYQETLRETWHLKGVEVVIDTWPGLDTYIEIEGKTEKEVKSIAGILELNWNNKIITSVVEIYMKLYNLTVDQVLSKLSNITFENDPFRGLGKKDLL